MNTTGEISTIEPQRLPRITSRETCICVRVFGTREGAFVYPKLDFAAAVIEFRVPAPGMGVGGNS